MNPPRPKPPLVVGISECLTGARVRYDGDHRRDGMPHTRQLEALFEWRGFCPEVSVGMGVPRPPIRLVGDLAAPRAIRVDDATRDFTDALAAYAATVVREAGLDLAGYVFTENSPSCGLYEVNVFTDGSNDPVPAGRGIYADALSTALPDLPVEEAGRLFDAGIRESFIDRAFAYAHWSALRLAGVSSAALSEFRGGYEYLLIAHSAAHCRRVARLFSGFQGSPDVLGGRYLRLLLAGLGQVATRTGHADALLHLAGQLDGLDRARRGELALQIAGFRAGEVAFQDVATALREACADLGRADLHNQVYLNPPGSLE
jgi:uncharacterized protein YbbK (DUF523 family)/uncharacterized protein YbgA (DUF1722 family)